MPRATARRCSSTSTGWGVTRSSGAARITGRSRRTRWRACRRGSSRAALSPPSEIPGAASTITPAGRGGGRGGNAGGGGGGGAGRGGGRGESPLYAALTAPELRDPRGFVLPSDQPDFGTATKFVNTLMKTGITIHRATAPFTVGGKAYPANSYVVKTAQAFRPHVMDMFEPQDHPDDIPYPGGPPTPPYDATGYTLAFQMGVRFDRILDDFSGPFEKLTDFAKVARRHDHRRGRAGRLLLHASGQRQLHRRSIGCWLPGEDVSWLQDGPMGAARSTWPRSRRPARFCRRPRPTSASASKPAPTAPSGRRAPAEAAHRPVRQYGRQHAVGLDAPDPRELRVPVRARVSAGPRQGRAPREVRRDRVQRCRPSDGRLAEVAADAGLVQPEIPSRLARPEAIPRAGRRTPPEADAEAVVAARRRSRCGRRPRRVHAASRSPRSSRDDRVRSRRRRSRQVKQFVQDGGTVIAIGASAMGAVQQFGLPVTNHLVENDNPLPREKFYVPGAVLQVSVDDTNPLAHGLGQGTGRVLRQRPGLHAGAGHSGSGLAASPGSRTPLRCAAAGRGASSISTRASRSSRPASARAGCF